MGKVYDPLPVPLENSQHIKLDQAKVQANEISPETSFYYNDINTIVDTIKLSNGVRFLINGVIQKENTGIETKNENRTNFKKSEYTKMFYNKNLISTSKEPVFYKIKSLKGKLNLTDGTNENQNFSIRKDASGFFNNFPAKQDINIKIEMRPILNSFFAKTDASLMDRKLPIISLNRKVQNKNGIDKITNDEFLLLLRKNDAVQAGGNIIKIPALLPNNLKFRKYKK